MGNAATHPELIKGILALFNDSDLNILEKLKFYRH